jgi:hypothetical protein
MHGGERFTRICGSPWKLPLKPAIAAPEEATESWCPKDVSNVETERPSAASGLHCFGRGARDLLTLLG